ncbi:hypothetical protein [Candidatus Binatus sp.]|uniref:hypothetical protein n=1 Tax=Candidatus Binatus sp. TaxID=2811406 RepID=UPI003C526BEE
MTAFPASIEAVAAFLGVTPVAAEDEIVSFQRTYGGGLNPINQAIEETGKQRGAA